MKSNLLIALIGLFLCLTGAVAQLGMTIPTAIKAATDTTLPAEYSIFAIFVAFATATDWIHIGLATVLTVIGIVWFVVAYRTKWFPNR